MVQGVHFQFFEGLILVLAAPLLFIFYLLYDSYRKRKLREYSSTQLLPQISVLPSTTLLFTKRFLLIGAWIFATAALMQPVGNPHYLYETLFSLAEDDGEEDVETERAAPHEIIFLLDASSSMLVRDTRKETSRFENAQEIIDAIASKLEGKNASLYAFTSELIPIVPATNDLLFLRLMAQNVSINQDETAGTDFYHVFAELRKKWSENPSELIYTLIILSDGDDTSLEGLVDPLRRRREAEILSNFNDFEDQIKILAIGTGSEKGDTVPGIDYKGQPVLSRMNVRFLDKLSEKGEGEFLIANNETPAGIAIEARAFIQSYETDSQFLEPFQYGQSNDFLVYDHYFQYPLALAILLLVLAQIIPETKKYQ